MRLGILLLLSVGYLGVLFGQGFANDSLLFSISGKFFWFNWISIPTYILGAYLLIKKD